MAANYVKDDEGGTFIPASQRPDGTWRKPRRVKDGYVPQEEVPLYESKGKQFQKNKPMYPVGMSPEYAEAQKAKKTFEATKTNPIPGLTIQPDTKKKKKKNKNKGTASAVTQEIANLTITGSSTKTLTKEINTVDKPEAISTRVIVNPEPNKQISTVDPLKRLKNLRKKIKEIDSLEKKIKSGEIKNPDKEMFDKVARKKEIQREIKELENNQ